MSITPEEKARIMTHGARMKPAIRISSNASACAAKRSGSTFTNARLERGGRFVLWRTMLKATGVITTLAAGLVGLWLVSRSTTYQVSFYLVGQDAVRHPDLVQRIFNNGHEIGNHSFTHPRLLLMTQRRIAAEIEQTDQALREAGYTGPLTFRPPYGKKLIGLPAYLARNQRASIMWSLAPEQWTGPIEERVARVRREITPGAIILLHIMFDHGQGARDMLDPLITALKADGYRFVTLSALLAAHAPE